MADPTTKTFTQLVQGQAAAIQARAAGLIDFSVGSILRAIVEAFAAVVLWLQGLILALLATTRAATSLDAALDSWVADFGDAYSPGLPASFARLGAEGSIGDLTFSRRTPTGTAVVLVGSTAETQDGSQKFVVALDTSHAAYRANLGGYLLADTVAAVTVPSRALTVGAGGNVSAGAINTITSALPGIDDVTNAADFINGQNKESDAKLRERFRAFLQSLREATPLALKYFIESLRAGTTATIVEHKDPNGSDRIAFFYFVVDDGTGTPPQSVLDAASAIVNLHRAAGIEYAVIAPTVVVANVAIDITTSANEAATKLIVAAAIRTYLNTRSGGEDVSYSRLYQVAYDASADVTDADALTINSLTADLAIPLTGVVKAGTITVT